MVDNIHLPSLTNPPLEGQRLKDKDVKNEEAYPDASKEEVVSSTSLRRKPSHQDSVRPSKRPKLTGYRDAYRQLLNQDTQDITGGSDVVGIDRVSMVRTAGCSCPATGHGVEYTRLNKPLRDAQCQGCEILERRVTDGWQLSVPRNLPPVLCFSWRCRVHEDSL